MHVPTYDTPSDDISITKMETVDIEAGIKGLLGLNLRPEAPAAAGQTASQAPSDLAAAPRQGRVEARQGQAPGSYPSKRKK